VLEQNSTLQTQLQASTVSTGSASSDGASPSNTNGISGSGSMEQKLNSSGGSGSSDSPRVVKPVDLARELTEMKLMLQKKVMSIIGISAQAIAAVVYAMLIYD